MNAMGRFGLCDIILLAVASVMVILAFGVVDKDISILAGGTDATECFAEFVGSSSLNVSPIECVNGTCPTQDCEPYKFFLLWWSWRCNCDDLLVTGGCVGEALWGAWQPGYSYTCRGTCDDPPGGNCGITSTPSLCDCPPP